MTRTFRRKLRAGAHRLGGQSPRLLLGIACVMIQVAGCGQRPQSQSQAAAQPPPSVTVSEPIERPVVQWDEYSGNLSSPDVSNVSARVSGLVERAPFQEGATVHAGDLLFEIDPRPFQADVNSKKAAVAQAQAQVEQAAVHLRRLDEVKGTRAISADDYDAAKAAYEEAQAQLAAAKAALDNSELNLQWTRVTAPITGRISRKYVQEGNLVAGGNGAGQATLLTTIVSIDPVYCYVQVPETAALRYQELALNEKGSDIATARIPCYVQVGAETGFPHPGSVDFIDNQVDTATGTVVIRGVFANANSLLTPGMFARMRVPGSGRYTALLIPDAAVNADQNERYVLVVGADGVVQRRPVVLGPTFGNLREIRGGLKPGERVIVEGVQRAHPGAKVTPHEAPVPTQSLDDLETTGKGAPMPGTQPVGSLDASGAPSSAPSTAGTPAEGQRAGSLAPFPASRPFPSPIPDAPPEYRAREKVAPTQPVPARRGAEVAR